MQPTPRLTRLFKPGQLTLPSSPQVGGGATAFAPYAPAAGRPASSNIPSARAGLVAALSGGNPDVATLIPLLQQIHQRQTAIPGVPARKALRPHGGTQAPISETAYTGKAGKVTFAAGADRAGVHTAKSVVQFVARVAGVYGKPLTIGTGTNHNEFVAGTNRVSDHWSGHAADIPASGAALTRLGQAALIAAGADPRWAHQQKGGLFNIGGHQIIFNTNEGGNHFNHLHVSAH